MKNKFCLVFLLTILSSSIFLYTGCGSGSDSGEKSSPDSGLPGITMTIKSDYVKFEMKGSGNYTIDWGDGQGEKPGSFDNTGGEASPFKRYSNATNRTIRIVGDNITYFECKDNQLESLDVSGLTTLVELNCGSNKLESLNVSGCTALQSLYCNDNQLESLNVSGLIALDELVCKDNKLELLDVSGLTTLVVLECVNNKLESLNVSGCTTLWWLDCSRNHLESLNVSGLTELSLLYCTNNQLKFLDVSGCTLLWYLVIKDNNMSVFALNDLFGQLPYRISFPIYDYGLLWIQGNPGEGSCTEAIATAKGWYVDIF